MRWTPRDVAFALAIASALLAIAWPAFEARFSACPLGYGAKTTGPARARHHSTDAERDADVTTFANCAVGDAGAIKDITVSRHGRIIAVEDVPSTRFGVVLDCGGRALRSGFVDAHAHVVTGGFALDALDLRGVRSKEEFIETLARAIDAGKEKWVLGHGWDETSWGGETPSNAWTRGDERFVGAKVWVTRTCGHVGFASEAALEIAKITGAKTVIAGGIVELDDEGAPTGILKELATAAMSNAVPKRSRSERDEAFKRAFEYLLSKGITTVGDFGDIESLVAGADGYAQLWEDFETLERWDAVGDLPIRITSYMPLGDWASVQSHVAWNSGWTRENETAASRVRLGGVKAFLDGSLGGRTAAMMAPYLDDGSTSGHLMYPRGKREKTLRKQATLADAAGLQIAVHAIGDAAVEQALELLASIEAANGERSLRRFRIEHSQHLTAPINGQPKRFKRLGAVASVQPAQIALDERSAAEKLGEERASRYYALRTFLENGVPLAGGSDWPIVSADVFAGMRAAVERGDGHESQSLTAEEATTMFTRGGAHALTLDGLVGTMAPGAFADFIILDSSSDSSSDSDIVATYVGGKCVHGRCLNGA